MASYHTAAGGKPGVVPAKTTMGRSDGLRSRQEQGGLRGRVVTYTLEMPEIPTKPQHLTVSRGELPCGGGFTPLLLM